ncbi:MAG: hypothetical protein JOZ83_13590 [Silvibacterium sp.]|nr:hypothetical protein [Silvibacterium sp.]
MGPLLFCAPIVCLAVYYTPLLVSLGWHATHGMSIDYRGLRVRVPFGWTVVATAAQDDYPENPQGITVEKQPRTLTLESGSAEMMYFNLLLPDPNATQSQQIAEWQNLFRQAHPDSSFEVAPVANAPSGMNCLQAIPRTSRSDAALACVSLDHGWVAQFAGSRAHVPVFLQVAATLKPKP